MYVGIDRRHCSFDTVLFLILCSYWRIVMEDRCVAFK
jgi:hypothetical protein